MTPRVTSSTHPPTQDYSHPQRNAAAAPFKKEAPVAPPPSRKKLATPDCFRTIPKPCAPPFLRKPKLDLFQEDDVFAIFLDHIGRFAIFLDHLGRFAIFLDHLGSSGPHRTFRYLPGPPSVQG